MKMKYPLVIVSVFIASIVLLAMLPNFIGATYTTEERTNDNTGWVRFNYSTGTTATINVTIAGGNISLGGSAPQTGPADDMIIWADNNLSVYIKDGSAYYIGNNNGTVSTGTLSDNFTISKLSNGVRITDNGTSYNFPVSIWAYIPNANGNYTSYLNGVSSHLNGNDNNRVFVGGVIDTVAYNGFNRYGYDLTLEVDQSDDIISGADWVGGAEPVNLSKAKLEPEIKVKDDPAPIKSVPTPTYTDGYWGYEITGGGYLADIVSYSGPAGDITIPATVGGYPVYYIGKGSTYNVFDTSLSDFTVTISNGALVVNADAFAGCTGLTFVNIPASVQLIYTSAFNGCTGLTSVNVDETNNYYSSENGILFNKAKNTIVKYPGAKTDISYTIPDTVTSLGSHSFSDCVYLESVTIPASVTSFNNFIFRDCTALNNVIFEEGITEINNGLIFYGCSNLKYITIPSSVTSIYVTAFTSSSITEVLNLSALEITGNDYGLSGATIYNEVPGWFYISNVHYTVSSLGSGTVYTLLRLIPVFFFIGLLIFVTKKLKDRENYQ